MKAFQSGGGKFVAPAQRMTDFVAGRLSADLPDCSYLPGLRSAPLQEVLPMFVYKALQKGFSAFGEKMRGYFTREAVIVATESRTSSPVRIPRDPGRLHHPQIHNLFPCGEGAGYAGWDRERCYGRRKGRGLCGRDVIIGLLLRPNNVI